MNGILSYSQNTEGYHGRPESVIYKHGRIVLPNGMKLSPETIDMMFDVPDGYKMYKRTSSWHMVPVVVGVSAGLYIFTGKPKEKYEYPDFKEDSKPYRLGTLYLGYHNYRIGYNSEKNVRGPIQNGFHDLFHYPHFAVLSIPDKLYYGLYTSTPFTVW